MCFFAYYVYVVSKRPIEHYRLKVAFYLASQNQMIITLVQVLLRLSTFPSGYQDFLVTKYPVVL